MEYVPAGQVVAPGDFGMAGFFLVSLLAHDFGAFQTKLHPGIGVDGICYPYLDYTFEVYGYLSKTQVTDTLRQKNRRTYPLVSLSQKSQFDFVFPAIGQ